jgi:uncharacterized protein (TIGR04255 family)
MNQTTQLHIDVSEGFPHLSRAAIREAVIEIRARASVPWNEQGIASNLKLKLGEYPQSKSLREHKYELHLKQGEEPKTASKDLGWQGVMFRSSDKRNIVKFQLGLFSLSRLHPYQRWEQFVAEATRLWEIHREIAQPSEIQRLGVRFINSFPVTQPVEIGDFFKDFPDDLPELNLVSLGFLHHDNYIVPGYPYGMNIIKTVQRSGPGSEGTQFILDIDVYTLSPFEVDTEMLNQRLQEMRWLKNKAFFGTITEKLKASLA